MSKLLSPLQVKNLIFRNRIVMSPMCQYSAINGYANYWHFVHYGTRSVGGCGAIIQEATAITPEGRITYGDLGLWDDSQITDLKRVTAFVENHGAIPGIQLAHAGRKASCDLPTNGGRQLVDSVNSWETVSASSIPFYEDDNPPVSLSQEAVGDIVRSFRDAALRAIEAGYKVIEIHAAHGYLIHQFYSPLSNQRSDQYGGSFENRIRLLLEIVDAISPEIDDNHSLWVRISATDWVEGGWDIEQSVRLAEILKEKGVDVIDVSTGGNVAHAKIPVEAGYQVPFADEIKKQTGIITGAVGLITSAEQSEALLEEDKCDLIFMGRKLLNDPYFPINAAKELDKLTIFPFQYERAYK